jgi:phosphate transport system substrate-binding protein
LQRRSPWQFWLLPPIPITEVTFEQLDAIYSAEPMLGGPRPITTWGQLGLTGDWADRPIRIYGLGPDTGTAQHVHIRVLQGAKWSSAASLAEGAPTRMYAGFGGHAADALVTALENDPYAIGVAGFRNRTDKIKALAVSEKGRPAVEGTQADNLLAAVSAEPLDLRIRPRRGEYECDPKVRELMRFVLSREGQEVVASEGEYLPLPEPSQVRNWIG